MTPLAHRMMTLARQARPAYIGDELEELAFDVELLEVELDRRRRAPTTTPCCVGCWTADPEEGKVRPTITCPSCGSAGCPRAIHHLNACHATRAGTT